MDEPIPTKAIHVDLDFKDIDTVRIIKSNTSLHITIPTKWKDANYLEAGDMIDVAILGVHRKPKKEEKK